MRSRVIIAALSVFEAVALAHNRRAVLSLPLAAAPVVPLAAVSAAAARPPTETCRPTGEMPSSTDVSCVGAGTGADTSLQRRTCCVCLSKPLQVVLIPCGHACLCRRCSRKLDKCPLCRLDIQATQRFYF